jgi:short-subunit dehydrogenase
MDTRARMLGHKRTVVITGASAGLGRAAALNFASHGDNLALIARNPERLESAARECRSHGVDALPLSVDVADAVAMDQAAERIEAQLGPVDVWVNSAMATVFAAVSAITPDEFKRATEVTYLGQVYGTMAALRRMRERNRGTIINVGSALAYRAIPLQSAYCGAKFAVRGFTESLRSEILHDRLAIKLCMVHLPAMNTPQFDWALIKTGFRAQPVPPIYQPEVGARAIYFMSRHPRRNLWVGTPTVEAILANRVAPGLLDRYFATKGYVGQLTPEHTAPGEPANLFSSVEGDQAAHGRFDSRASASSFQALADRHRTIVAAASVLGSIWLVRRLRRRSHGDARARQSAHPRSRS